MFKFNKSAGQAARLLLVLAIVVLVAVVIVYLVMKMAAQAPKPIGQKSTTPVVPQPVYEKQLENINFIFQSAADKGNVLKAADVTNAEFYSNQKDFSTTDRFVEVAMGAQNMGTVNTEQGAWNIGDIVDSKGRHFVADDYSVNPWLPNPNLCGALLKPAFQPTLCTKIYEVSKESTGLKITVETGQGNSASNLSSGKKDTFLIDLIVN